MFQLIKLSFIAFLNRIVSLPNVKLTGNSICWLFKSKFDLSGRVYKGVPAPTNLQIPPYSFLDDQTVLIGVDPQGAV